jgi:putative PIG3 family NAD(P)H quinone oxidoreductase
VWAVVAADPGGPEVLSLAEVDDAVAGPDEVLLRVAAAGINRADLLQRQGHYPPPPGASPLMGLECSGTVEALGAEVSGWSVGDEVCALLSGGGYAELVAVPAGQLLPIPAGVDLVTAAALPEAAATVWSNLFMVARLQEGETLLVHGGAGGIGSFAIQLASRLGVRVLATAGSPDKLGLCRELGADTAISYRDQDFVEEVERATEGRGVDVVLDNMGAAYLQRNIAALARNGRVVVIGMQGGRKTELDLGGLFAKNGTLSAILLRPRPVAEKAAICAEVVERVWPLVADGRIVPRVHATYPFAEAAAAHADMESGTHTGKILLTAP